MGYFAVIVFVLKLKTVNNGTKSAGHCCQTLPVALVVEDKSFCSQLLQK